MSDIVYQKNVHLVVRARGPAETDFAEANYRLPSNDLPSWVGAGHGLDLSITISGTHTYDAWAKAYACQGRADLKVYRELRKLREAREIEDCHELHYLQMALEKIARAFLLKRSRGDRRAYLLSHVAVSEFASSYAKSPEHRARFEGQGQLWAQVKVLAGEIEHLTPAVERQARPANVEYPWSDGRTLRVPSEIQFLSGFRFTPTVWAVLIALLDEVSAALAA